MAKKLTPVQKRRTKLATKPNHFGPRKPPKIHRQLVGAGKIVRREPNSY